MDEQAEKALAILSVGANLPTAFGGVRSTVLSLMDELSKLGTVQKRSALYFGEAMPKGSAPDYYNGAVLLETALKPKDLLNECHLIEAAVGRIRTQRWAARGADIDLIAYGERILPDRPGWQYWYDLPLEDQKVFAPDQLILPHPRLQDRLFVLLPMREVAPDWVHPVTGRELKEMIADAPRMDIRRVEAA